MKIKLLITLLFILVISFLNAQNVTIPDTNFKNYLLNHTGINTNGDNEIQISEAESFTGTINCYYRGISDLTGIEAFVNLTGLDCQYNQLTSLDISNNKALRYLDCRDNYLTTLDVSNNTALRHLNTYYNPLTSLDVSNNLVLTDLICGGNELTSLDVSNNTALTYLNCETNQLISLDLSNNTALQRLSSNRNQLTSLDLSNNIHLTYMNCYFNPITCLDLSHNTALIQLYCMGCELTSLNIRNGTNTNMTHVRAENNSELLCVQVDDVNWSTSNWIGNNFEFDSGINFSEDCEYVSVSDYQEIICNSSNDETESVNLTNYSQYLIENSSDYSFEYYFSESGALNQTISDMITSYSNHNLSIGLNTIYVRIDSDITCNNVMELNNVVELRLVLVNEPEIPMPEIVMICERETVVLNVGSEFDSYLWSTGETLQSIIISQEGNYWVTVSQIYQDGISCESTHHFSVKKTEPIHIAEIKIDDWTDSNNTITILPYNENYVYSLDGFMYQNENYFENLSNGKYSVFVKDRGDCDEAMEVVYLLTYPKFFTPNGDGINDYWRIKLSQYQELLNVEIYDRYGKLITFFDKNSIGWDGKLNGRDLPATDYWFKITRVSDRKIIYRGHFSLIR